MISSLSLPNRDRASPARAGMSTATAAGAAAAAELPAGDVVFYVFALVCIVAIVAARVCLYLRCGYSLLRDRADTQPQLTWIV